MEDLLSPQSLQQSHPSRQDLDWSLPHLNDDEIDYIYDSRFDVFATDDPFIASTFDLDSELQTDFLEPERDRNNPPTHQYPETFDPSAEENCSRSTVSHDFKESQSVSRAFGL